MATVGAFAASRQPCATSLLRWRATEAKTRALCVALAIFCGVLWLAYANRIIAAFGSNSSEAHGDFFALWSYAKIAVAYPATDLYDFATVHAHQVALGMTPSRENPFPYPPTAILLLLPLSLWSYHVAYAVWIAATFAVFLWVIVATCWRTPGVVLPIIIAPMTAIAVETGQSGFLSGALLIGGLRLAANRPVLSGILLSILSYKPQLALLVPVALVAAGLWRTCATAAVMTIGQAVAATLTFGWDVWPAWIHMLPLYSHWFAQSHIILPFMPTVQANLRMIGVDQGIANIVQVVSAIAMVVIVWRSFRHGPSPSATAVLLVATFLCTPHAVVYDAPALTGALVLFVATRLRGSAIFSLTEIVVLIMAVLFPFVMVLKGCEIPVSSAVLLALLTVIARDEPRHRTPLYVGL